MRHIVATLLLSAALISCGAISSKSALEGEPQVSPLDPVSPVSKDKTDYQQAEPFGIEIEVIPPPIVEDQPPAAIQSTSTQARAFLVMSPTGLVNSLGNPLFKVEFISNNKLIDTFTAVSGRAHTQNRNRNVSGTQAPLPNGKYRVAFSSVPGTSREVGGRFLPITPMFRTGRFALGFHYDPSFDINPVEDGTDGCIGLTTPEQRDRLFKLVQQYRPSYLEVNL